MELPSCRAIADVFRNSSHDIMSIDDLDQKNPQPIEYDGKTPAGVGSQTF